MILRRSFSQTNCSSHSSGGSKLALGTTAAVAPELTASAYRYNAKNDCEILCIVWSRDSAPGKASVKHLTPTCRGDEEKKRAFRRQTRDVRRALHTASRAHRRLVVQKRQASRVRKRCVRALGRIGPRLEMDGVDLAPHGVLRVVGVRRRAAAAAAAAAHRPHGKAGRCRRCGYSAQDGHAVLERGAVHEARPCRGSRASRSARRLTEGAIWVNA